MNDSKTPASTRHLASRRELKEEFVVADLDRDGRVSFAEFKRLLEGLEAGVSEQEMHIGFREVDTDADGLIDCKEFIDWWTED